MATEKRTQKPRPKRSAPRSQSSSPDQAYAGEPSFAIRIVFEYDADTLRVVSTERVDMMVPLSDPTDDYRGREGSWIELQNADGSTVYRQVLSHAIPSDVEALSDADGHPLTRRAVEHPKGTFVALLPELESARTLVVCHQPAGRIDAAAMTREALRIPFPPRARKSSR